MIVDVAIDQGGCFETSRPTTHALADDPCFAQGLNVKEGKIVYEPVARAYAEGTPVAAW